MTWFAVFWALWLGILTSVSPCPLASNIAAISFIGRKVGSTRTVLISGLLYTLGRTAVYVAIGIVIMAGLLASGEIAIFLQLYLNQILGPVLIIVGCEPGGSRDPAACFAWRVMVGAAAGDTVCALLLSGLGGSLFRRTHTAFGGE